VCSDLSQNTLTGSVPSSLSALTKLTSLCVPPCCHRRLLVRPRRVGSVGSAPSSAACREGGCMSGHRGGAVRQQGCCGTLRVDPRARHVTKEYSRGTPSHGYSTRIPLGAHGCCGRGVVSPERPSPLRVCRYLYDNKLNGGVPSSLSALTKLSELCVPPCCERRLHACSRGGSDRSALLRGMSGVACRGHRGRRCGSRAVAELSERTLARDATTEYSRGTPSHGVQCADTVEGTWLLWVRRSTARAAESASGV
jgi:hypothetical protein